MKTLKHFFSQIFKKRAKPPIQAPWPNIERDWAILLISFFGATVLVTLLSGLLFLRISRGDIFLANKSETDSKLTIDRDALQKTLDVYENRARGLQDIEAHPKTFADPAN